MHWKIFIQNQVILPYSQDKPEVCGLWIDVRMDSKCILYKIASVDSTFLQPSVSQLVS